MSEGKKIEEEARGKAIKKSQKEGIIIILWILGHLL